MSTEKFFRAEIPDGMHLDDSRDVTGAYRGTMRNENNQLKGHANLYEVDVPDDSLQARDSVADSAADVGGGVLAGLALVGLTLGAVAIAGAVIDRKSRRLQNEQQVVHNVNASPGWYEADPGRQRWWNGQKWTDQYRSDPHYLPAPAGWYDDGSGRQRWWDGIEWTAHFQASQGVVAAPMAASEVTTEPSLDLDVAPDVPLLTMSSAEWQQRVRAMLVARAISEQQWRMLSVADIQDANAELLAWQHQLAGLTPQQFSDQLSTAIESDPVLADSSLGLAQAGWYDDGSGVKRWWNGRLWTEHYETDPMAVRASAQVAVTSGRYDDGSECQNWA